jgi:hypothetical protein
MMIILILIIIRRNKCVKRVSTGKGIRKGKES